jgi:hypothetical protein
MTRGGPGYVEGPQFLGQIINHFVATRATRGDADGGGDRPPRPTILRSTDGGATWTEAKRPPAFPKGDPHGRAVDHSFWLEPGHAGEPGVWWVGSSPPGLFAAPTTATPGESVEGLNQHPQVMAWFPREGGTPDGAISNQ